MARSRSAGDLDCVRPTYTAPDTSVSLGKLAELAWHPGAAPRVAAAVDFEVPADDPQELLDELFASPRFWEHMLRWRAARERIQAFVRANHLPEDICDSLKGLWRQVETGGSDAGTRWQFYATTIHEIECIAQILERQGDRPDTECITALGHWAQDLHTCLSAKLGHIQRTLQVLQGLRGGFAAAWNAAERELQQRVVARLATTRDFASPDVHVFQALDAATRAELPQHDLRLYDEFGSRIVIHPAAGARTADEVQQAVTPDAIAAEMAGRCLETLRALLAGAGIREPIPADAWLAFDPCRTGTRDPESMGATLIAHYGDGFTPQDLFAIDVGDDAMPARVSHSTALLAFRFLQRAQQETGRRAPPGASCPLPDGEAIECWKTAIVLVRMADGRVRRLEGEDLRQVDPRAVATRPELKAAMRSEAFLNTDAAGRLDWPPLWLGDGHAMRLLTNDMSLDDFNAFADRVGPYIWALSLQSRCNWVLALSEGPQPLQDFMRAVGLVLPGFTWETRELLSALLCADRPEPALAILRGLDRVDKEPSMKRSLLVACIRAGQPGSVKLLLEFSPNFGKRAGAVFHLPDRRRLHEPRFWDELLLSAAKYRQPGVLRALHAAGRLDYGSKAFVSLATRAGNVEALEAMHELAREAARPDGLQCHRKVPWVALAARRNRLATVAYLAERGMDLNAKVDGRTPLAWSDARGYEEMSVLLRRMGARKV